MTELGHDQQGKNSNSQETSASVEPPSSEYENCVRDPPPCSEHEANSFRNLPHTESDPVHPYLCYFIELDRRFTYIGVTNNFPRRIRQHNGEICGGAKYTTSKKTSLQQTCWQPVLFVKGFPDYRSALQFEWRWKSLSRKKNLKSLAPVKKRLQALVTLLNLERATKKSQPMAPWNLRVVWQPAAYFQDLCSYHSQNPCRIKLKLKSSGERTHTGQEVM